MANPVVINGTVNSRKNLWSNSWV